ncbi:hypothetical protein R5R35_006235 [Gryllus longicercus]|uniref:Uncharacterized protein n=1 Tax=Gryllus longicercus TaxID=2509291 RepID=A0AAN9VYZ9_9ORTH
MWFGEVLGLALVACFVHVACLPNGGGASEGGRKNPAKDRENNPECKEIRKEDDKRNFKSVIRQVYTNGSADSDFELDEEFCISGVVNLDFPLSSNMVHFLVRKKTTQKWDIIIENDLPWPDFINKFTSIFSPLNCAIKCNKGEPNDDFVFESNTNKCEEIYFDRVCLFPRTLPQDFAEATYQMFVNMDSDCDLEGIGMTITFEVLSKTEDE